MAAAIRRALAESEGEPARLPARRRRDRAHRRAARARCRPTSISTASTAASIPPPSAPRSRAGAGGPAQARPRHVDRRDQPDPRRRPHRRRFGPRPAAALRPRRRPHPAGHRARQPGGGRPSAPAAPAARGRAASTGSGRRRRRRACRASTRPKSSRPTFRRCCSTARSGASPTRARCAGSTRRRAAAIDEARQAPARARRARRGRPPHRPWPRHRRAAAAAAPRPHADRGRRRAAGAETAAEVAVLLSERGLGGNDADLELRLRRWRGEKGRRADAARGLARQLARACRRREGRAKARSAPASPWPFPTGSRSAATRPAPTGSAPAAAASGSIPPRRSRARPGWRSPRSPAPPPARASFPPRRSRRRRSRLCSPIASRAATEVAFDPATGGVRAAHGRRLGAILLSGGQDSRAEPAAIEAALARRACAATASACCRGARPRDRCAAARPSPARCDPSLPDLSDEALLARLDEWLPPLLAGKRRLADVDPADARACSAGTRARRVDRLAPSHFETPAGSRHPIDYDGRGRPDRDRPRPGPVRPGRASEGRGDVPLVLALTSPAGRPIQTTRDLPGFWRGSWAAVAKEMRGRYPKHPWPDDPAAADPTLAERKEQCSVQESPPNRAEMVRAPRSCSRRCSPPRRPWPRRSRRRARPSSPSMATTPARARPTRRSSSATAARRRSATASRRRCAAARHNAEQAWGARVETLDEVSRDSRPNSCSVVGSYGQSGCTQQMIQQWYNARRARRLGGE